MSPVARAPRAPLRRAATLPVPLATLLLLLAACSSSGARHDAPPALPAATGAAGAATPGAGAAAGAAGAGAQEGDAEAADAEGPDAEGPGGEPAGLVRGRLGTELRARSTGDDSDLDLFVTLSLDVGDERRDAVTGHVLARATADLDGDQDQDGNYAFDSLADTYDSAVNAKLYRAYADVHSVESLDVLRFGRQVTIDTPEFGFFDGVRVESAEVASAKDLQWGLYGGVPVHLYESSPEGDAIYGGLLQARPWRGGRVRLDWMHIEDEYLYGDQENDLVGLGLWHTFEAGVQLDGLYTRLDDHDRDVRLRGSWYAEEADLLLRGTYYELLRAQSELTVDLDPFSGALRELQPYRQVGLLASKGVGEHMVIDLGLDVRRLDDSDDEGTYNHEFERYYLTWTHDAVAEGLSLSLTGDLWDADETETSTVGLDLTQEFSESLEGSLGTFYSLYKYDVFLDEERDDVQTYYIDVRNERGAHTVRVRYEFEDDAFDSYHTLRLGWSWTF